MDKIKVLEKGHELEYSFDDLLNYHGVGYPGGVAHAFQVMSRAFPLLDNGKLLERREIYLITAFPGPGGLDAFEMVTRCVTGGRISVDINLKEAEEVLESPHGRGRQRVQNNGAGGADLMKGIAQRKIRGVRRYQRWFLRF